MLSYRLGVYHIVQYIVYTMYLGLRSHEYIPCRQVSMHEPLFLQVHHATCDLCRPQFEGSRARLGMLAFVEIVYQSTQCYQLLDLREGRGGGEGGEGGRIIEALCACMCERVCICMCVYPTSIIGLPPVTPISFTMQGWFRVTMIRASRMNSCTPIKTQYTTLTGWKPNVNESKKKTILK